MMTGEEKTAKAYVRQYLAFLGKTLLLCSAILLVVDFLLPAFEAIVALVLGLYLFVSVYHYILIKPVVIQDALFWVTYGVFMGLTFVALRGICTAAPAISATCKPRLLEGLFFLGRGFPAVVTIIFWIIARLMRIVRNHPQQTA